MSKYKIPTIDGIDIVFRLLSAPEADRLFGAISISNGTNPNIEEFIFNEITDNAYDINTLCAGTIITVVTSCFNMSGFIRDKSSYLNMIDFSRDKVAKNGFFNIYRNIHMTQPNYKLEELKAKPLSELMELLSYSEMIVGKPFIDTQKEREAIEKSLATPLVPEKKGVKGFSLAELDAIKQAISSYDENLNDEDMIR